MNFHNVKSVDVERDNKRGWTTIKITRHERLDVDVESEVALAKVFGIDKWEMANIVRSINKNGTVTDEITLFHVDDGMLDINMETVDE
jgi:hypothetical protein